MRIGTLADAAYVSPKTIRFYEGEGLLPEPPRSLNGYRDYPRETVSRLTFIRHAQAAGLTLAEIRGVLAIRDSGDAPCHHVTDLITQRLDEVRDRIKELRETQTALAELQRKAAAVDPADCSDSDICSILRKE